MAGTELHLFEAFGVELEYMIVDGAELSVRPIADEVLFEAAGQRSPDVELGEIAWSNELVLHVIELKTNGPARSLEGLPALFHHSVQRINSLLAPRRARLMPTAMHPWMDPDAEMKLWPHDYNPVYEAYHRIFNCRGHGWANLQSVHLNLPFAGDEEFGRLHAAIRLLMPILPAIAASSPVVGRQVTGLADNRLEAYRHNSRRVPSLAGEIVPEPVFDRAAYDREIMQRMFDDIAPHDAEGILRHEFLNSRGAIARFDRGAIEIRVLDVQECPAADVAICAAIVHVLKQIAAERFTPLAEQKSLPTRPLAELFVSCIRDAERTVIDDPRYLAQLGFPPSPITAGDAWRQFMESVLSPGGEILRPLETILARGPLARRIERRLGGPGATLESVYGELCDCLAENTMLG